MKLVHQSQGQLTQWCIWYVGEERMLKSCGGIRPVFRFVLEQRRDEVDHQAVVRGQQLLKWGRNWDQLQGATFAVRRVEHVEPVIWREIHCAHARWRLCEKSGGMWTKNSMLSGKNRGNRCSFEDGKPQHFL